jgi:hypothetical protein
MNLCRCKHVFGKPGESAYRFRIFDIAIADTVLTVLLAYVISYLSGISLMYVIPWTFIFGIVLHHIFCVRTTVDKLLFPNLKNAQRNLISLFYNQ